MISRISVSNFSNFAWFLHRMALKILISDYPYAALYFGHKDRKVTGEKSQNGLSFENSVCAHFLVKW